MHLEHDIIILGAGISGLGASYGLRQRGIDSLIIEKDDTYGGLCGNFEINGFRFDRFVHFSFTKDPEVNDIFMKGAGEIYRHIPDPYNLYHGKWIKHPAQNNIFPLSVEEKEHIISDFRKRPDPTSIEPRNYEQWLRIQYGNYFAENFPMRYTRKYWMTEASQLETRWIGNRLYQPSLEEVIKGASSADTPVTYYAKEMRYPRKGGYKSFLKHLADNAKINYGEQVVSIDPVNKTIKTIGETGKEYRYHRLISSIPLPDIIKMLSNVPSDVSDAANSLKCTSGYQLSIGLRIDALPLDIRHLWWYIYDEDILAARVYSPSMKSHDNAPDGCSSLQMEIYCTKDQYTEQEILDKSLGYFISKNIINKEDILFTDLRYEPYANVIFDHNIYHARSIVRQFLSDVGITTIGRFGEWDYLWSDQSLLSGLNVINI